MKVSKKKKKKKRRRKEEEDPQQEKILSRKSFMPNQLISTIVNYIYKWAWLGVVSCNCQVFSGGTVFGKTELQVK